MVLIDQLGLSESHFCFPRCRSNPLFQASMEFSSNREGPPTVYCSSIQGNKFYTVAVTLMGEGLGKADGTGKKICRREENEDGRE